MWLLRAFCATALLLLVVGGSPASAQGCGPTNPNCIVPTAPLGTNNNQAASTAFVDAAVAASTSGFYTGLSGDCTATSLGVITCTKTNGVIFYTGLPSPVNPADAATKAYVDSSVSAGLTPHPSVILGTATALAANTYNNGTSGVGATLTANSNGALSIDGSAVTTSERVLVKNESTAANNGIYVVTQTGGASTPYILTRATDANTPSTGNPNEIGFGTYVLVTSGTANTATGWSVSSTVSTIGTSAINWTQFSAGSGVLQINSQTGNVTIAVASGLGIVSSGGTITISNSALPFGGRLVASATGCSSSTPAIQNANIPNVPAICLVVYKSNNVPINGINYTFSVQQLTPTNAGTTNIYDIYEIISSGSPVIVWDITPWTNSTTPANPKKFANGVWTNTNTISTLENAGSVIATSVASGNATYLGSFYATTLSETTWTPTPTPASGGTNNCLCLYNAPYNQVPVTFLVRDSVGTFTFGSVVDGTWEYFDNNQNNQASMLDGLGLASYNFNFQISMSMDSANPNKGQVAGAAAICIDCTISGSPATPNNPIAGWGTQGGCGAWTIISTNANGGSACGTNTAGFATFPGVGYGGGSLPTQSPLGLHTFALVISGNWACTSCTTTGPLWYGSIAGGFGGQMQD